MKYINMKKGICIIRDKILFNSGKQNRDQIKYEKNINNYFPLKNKEKIEL